MCVCVCVRGGTSGSNRCHAATHLFVFCCAVLKRDEATHHRRLSSGACWESLITISGSRSRNQPRPEEKPLIVSLAC